MSSSASPPAAPSFPRRDKLRELEAAVRERFAQEKPFESDVEAGKEKFFVTFPYPYMNGRLHLGHAFSCSKADFTAAYQRLKGKNVLFPFGFHVTGMPIAAAANKIKNEMEKYGNPPDKSLVEQEQAPSGKDAEGASAAPGNFKSKKTKTARKTGGKKLQWDILRDMGLSDEQIAKFSDPLEWLDYFPSLGEQDLQLFGLHTDWRRSFITSESNPFYDQFIRWQFTRLRQGGKIDFGRRATIYSPLDKQACADHDRSSGEGVGPQEYTLIKLAPLELPESVTEPRIHAALEAGKLFMVAATLRPETMYGQTNCFVLPTGEYGAYEFNVQTAPGSAEREKQVLICSERSATNMSYQDPFCVEEDWGKLELLGKIKGKELIGLPIKAPKTSYERVYCLPLLTISMNKGTGVVTSVPSDAPDDYAALRDWQKDAKLREKHGVTEEMVAPFEVLPIINIPGMGDKSAVFMCDKLKVKSQNDKKKLEEAKEATYKEGFYKGVMLVGEADGVKGMKVSEAKDVCKAKMCADGEAFTYYEPEKEVLARSGCACVVAYLDQWFIKYGEPSWAAQVRDHVTDPAKFETYTPATRKAFTEVVDWLKEWACSRNFGLGTLVPFDERFVIESLSDSTIYMAYYTIAHLLQGRKDDRDYTGDGGKHSPLGIKAEQLTPEVFDYIFLQKDFPAGCGIEQSKLDKLRESFEYWYPMNLRVSGRDLVQNHLTMALYNHAAIWHERPEMMPKGFYANGFIEVEGEKISKSTGNFIMLNESIAGHRSFQIDKKQITVGWNADSVRLALAGAGDSLEDANFSCDTADKSILRLTTELDLAEELFSEGGKKNLRQGGEYNFWDRAFDAQIDVSVLETEKQYDAMRFRDVAKYGFYELFSYRDQYREACTRAGTTMHFDLVEKFTSTFAIIMSPICTFFCEHLWKEVLGRDGFVCKASWPTTSPPNLQLVRSVQFLQNVCRDVRVKINSDQKRMAKKGTAKNPVSAVVGITEEFPAHIKAILTFLGEKLDRNTNSLPADIMKQVKTFVQGNDDLKKMMKNVLQKAAFVVSRLAEEGPEVLETSVSFDQGKILSEQREFCEKAMGLPFSVMQVDETDQSATPGSPSISITYEE